eukprot:2933444-Amphidinium_carterae.1
MRVVVILPWQTIVDAIFSDCFECLCIAGTRCWQCRYVVHKTAKGWDEVLVDAELEQMSTMCSLE